MKIEQDRNDSLSTEHKDEIEVVSHKSMNLLISSIFKNHNPSSSHPLRFHPMYLRTVLGLQWRWQSYCY
jgi:hypothetical protein